ncbi:hypothetical protein BC941DRAFT_431185 [Chlamydoabsidia padenii]|nr:hypothetical protein BC941DRAFT_431185 [Chlamydoabsidia padenii]
MLLQHHQQGSFTTSSLLSSSSSSSPSPSVPISSPSDHHHPLHLPFKHRDSYTDNASDDLDEAFFLQQMTQSLPECNDTQPPLDSLSPSAPEFYHKDTTMTPNTMNNQKPRKRREMQAITKLVETRDNPYLDGHFWRNNGNTIQKKTGNKSVYFKCSNSTKGCPVNKTSTYCQETGEYLIKYRGEHLPECGKVQHIVEV